jgi:hypothetical protein
MKLLVGNNNVQIDLSTITSGVYNLQIIIDGEMANAKIVKR